MPRIKLVDLFAAFLVAGRLDQLIPNHIKAVVHHWLTVMRHVPVFKSIEIPEPDFGSIFSQITCDPVNGVLNNSHALRPSESTESRVGRQVGFPHASGNAHVWNIIGIFGMEKRPLKNGKRKIPCNSCIAVHINNITGDQSFIIKSDFVIALKTVALAGDFLVVVAEENHFYRPAGMMCQQGSPGGNMISLGFLSSEPTAHAFHFAFHFIC